MKLKYLFRTESELPSLITDINEANKSLEELREQLTNVGIEEESKRILDEIMSKSNDYDRKCDIAQYLAEKSVGESLKDFITIKKTITLHDLSKIVNDLNVTNKTIDERQSVVVYFTADEDFPEDILIVLAIEGEWLKMVGYPLRCDIIDAEQKQTFLLDCNEYNRTTRYIKAYVDNDGMVTLERQDYLDRWIPYSTLKDRMGIAIVAMYNFFKERKSLFEEVIKKNREINLSQTK